MCSTGSFTTHSDPFILSYYRKTDIGRPGAYFQHLTLHDKVWMLLTPRVDAIFIGLREPSMASGHIHDHPMTIDEN